MQKLIVLIITYLTINRLEVTAAPILPDTANEESDVIGLDSVANLHRALLNRDPTELIDSFDRLTFLIDLKRGCWPDAPIFAATSSHELERLLFEMLVEFPTLTKEVRQQFSGLKIDRVTGPGGLNNLLSTALPSHEKIFYMGHCREYYYQ